MQDDIASFISFQVRRSAENGDVEQAMAQMRRFLELERESKSEINEGGSEPQMVRRLPGLRVVN